MVFVHCFLLHPSDSDLSRRTEKRSEKKTTQNHNSGGSIGRSERVKRDRRPMGEREGEVCKFEEGFRLEKAWGIHYSKRGNVQLA